MWLDIYGAAFFGHPPKGNAPLVVMAVAVVLGLLSLVLVFNPIRVVDSCGSGTWNVQAIQVSLCDISDLGL